MKKYQVSMEYTLAYSDTIIASSPAEAAYQIMLKIGVPRAQIHLRDSTVQIKEVRDWKPNE